MGASLAGVATAEGLRAAGFTGSICQVGAEPHLPYDRPPLSKGLLASGETPGPEAVLLRPRQWFIENQIDLVLGTQAAALDPSRRSVALASGESVIARDVVIATGSSARSLPGVPAGLRDVYSLRSWDDFTRLANRLQRPGRLVVIGAGFIGLEAIGAAARRGWQVTVVERDNAVLNRVLPSQLGELCWRPFEQLGVELLLNAAVTSVTQGCSGVRVGLDSGDVVAGDATLVAAGGVPNTGWLAGSGLRLSNGIACDAWGRTSAEHMWAVGDVAAWHNEWTGQRGRVEQWQAAREQAAICAEGIAGKSCAGWAGLPYFWSDLPVGRVQFSGEFDPAATIHLFESGAKALALVEKRGVLRGVWTLRAPRLAAQGQALLTGGSPIGSALDWAAESLPARQPLTIAGAPPLLAAAP